MLRSCAELNVQSRCLSRRFLAGVAACFISSACGVTESELHGTWVIAASSRELLPPRFHTPASQLVLKSDGTFTVSQMPPSMIGRPDQQDPTSPDYVIDGSGRWRLDESRTLALSFRTLGGAPMSLGASGIVAEKWWSSVEVFYWIGDPDAAPSVILERSN